MITFLDRNELYVISSILYHLYLSNLWICKEIFTSFHHCVIFKFNDIISIMYSQSSHLSFHHSIPLSSNSMISSTIHYIHQKFKSFRSNNPIHQILFNKSNIKFNYQSIVFHITSFIQSSLSFVGELITIPFIFTFINTLINHFKFTISSTLIFIISIIIHFQYPSYFDEPIY